MKNLLYFADICCSDEVKLDVGLSGIHAVPETDMV